ncbi:MAG: hypothetical protein Dasosvirus6_11 [Dasosvirus sp.]|uniref:Uncharacterized protein n=1 Tax=Dasosvirus sp. TaxID=2487764 RepID=A0A3G4ZVS3_9VIRU|nr:MAG: hypothetical protein Dasosvirus6_11 [Dasosvirus sp.]
MILVMIYPNIVRINKEIKVTARRKLYTKQYYCRHIHILKTLAKEQMQRSKIKVIKVLETLFIIKFRINYTCGTNKVTAKRSYIEIFKQISDMENLLVLLFPIQLEHSHQ